MVKGVMTVAWQRRFWLICCSFFAAHILAGEDYPGSKDHPALRRYPGSAIVFYDQREFDEYSLLLGPVRSTAEKDVENAQKRRLEGKVTKITYEGPPGRSNFEVFKNYELALEKAGYEVLYRGKGNEIRGVGEFLQKLNREHVRGWTDPDEHPTFYLSAKSPDGNTFISLYVHGGERPVTVLAVVEPKALETELVTAQVMQEQIEKSGKAALYGIYFDFDSAEIKPESKPTLDALAKLLHDNPGLKLYVVGHTDAVGTLEYNMDLSQRRAQAVVQALAGKYGVQKERLKAFGVGPLCPVAPNATEEGRAKNRRVEVVKQN